MIKLCVIQTVAYIFLIGVSLTLAKRIKNWIMKCKIVRGKIIINHYIMTYEWWMIRSKWIYFLNH